MSFKNYTFENHKCFSNSDMSLGNSKIMNNRVDKVFISYVNIGYIYREIIECEIRQ